MTRNFLLFGGSGFIGYHLVNLIKERNDERSITFDIKKNQNQDTPFERVDVREAIKTKYKPAITDVIYNLAAVHRTPGHLSEEYFKTNLLGAENICNYAREHNINTIIFTSSIATYGTYESSKSEETVPRPDIPYGISKLTAEYIHILWQKEDDLNRKLIILRPGVVFGQYEKGNFTRLINSIARRRFFYPGRKDTIKACIYVKDLTNVMFQMINRELVGVSIYNMTYEPAPSIENICEIIGEKGTLSKPKMILPPFMLLLIGKAIYMTTRNEGFHPERIRKLMISNNINGAKMNNIYHLKYGLEDGIGDWMKDTRFDNTGVIY